MAYANLDGFGWLVDDMQTWTAAQIASAGAHYEPKLRFDSTPVYSVTLAEDTAADAATPYEVDLSAVHSRKVLIFFDIPGGTNSPAEILVEWSGGSTSQAQKASFFGSNAVFTWLSVENDAGFAKLDTPQAAATASTGAVYSASRRIYVGAAEIVSVSIYPTAVSAIPSGTIISVYAAQEV